jgi:UDP-GlcNAc3NAcA epimerase
MKVLTVVGARPQFIKASVLCRALQNAGLSNDLVHTGQHYDRVMSAIFFQELGIAEPFVDLEVGSASHGAQTAAALERLEGVMVRQQPDRVLVLGDTNSTLAGALAAAKLHIPVDHVEAGLRSFNRGMPEEVNRIVADDLSELLFAPTETAARNLIAEGKDSGLVRLVGDVMHDAALIFGPMAERRSEIVGRLKCRPGEFVLCTVHRAENTDDPTRLKVLLQGLSLVAETIPVVLPLHPRTRARAMGLDTGSVVIIDPVGYLDMLMLERAAAVIATDSGGVQKEAFFHAVPCVTLRTETEWVELVDLGWNTILPPATPEAVSDGILRAIGTEGRRGEPFGDGHAAERVAEVLVACDS